MINMSNQISLQDLDTQVQLGLRNIVNSPISQSTRLGAYNRVIDFLQSKSNWNATKRVAAFDYLNGETDYSLANSLLITDFKQYKDLRVINDSQTRHWNEYEEVDGNKFSIKESENAPINLLTFEDRDTDKIMRVLSEWNQGDTIVDEMSNLTTGRTWASDTSGSDATTLAVDTTRVKSGAACLKFNISVAQSSNNYARISTTTPFSTVIDASDLLNNGYFRFWLGLHSVSAANLALISSITFIWGSDSSNYWTQTTTTAINNGAFKNTWNRVGFDWATATQTGSPNAASLAYFEIRINYSAGFTNSNNIRVDQIKMFTPLEMELIYFSTLMVNNSGTLQQHFSATYNGSEKLVLPYTHLNLVVNKALELLFPMEERNSDDYLRVKEEAKGELELAINQDGNSITREKNEFQVQGNSNGRDDNWNNQW